jgi:gliding motility-associated-like protein
MIYKKIFLICLLLVAYFGGLAQACFTTDVRKGCFPLKVTATNCSATADSRLIFYDFGDGSTPTTENSHTYNKAGKYFIKQYINSNPGQQSDGNYLIEVLQPETPRFTVEFCSENRVAVKILSSTMPQYKIEYGDGNSAEVAGLTSTTHQYTDKQPKNITVSGYFPTEKITCGSASQSITPLNQIPAADLQEVRLLPNNAVQLSFRQTKPYNYKISEFSTNTNSLQTINLVDNAQNQLTLSNKNTTSDLLLYRINAIDQCRNTVSLNSEGIATVQLTAEAQPKQNVLRWNVASVAGFVAYKVYRDATLLQTIADTETKTFIDDKVTCNQWYDYTVELVLYEGKSKSISAVQRIRAASARLPVPIRQLTASTDLQTVILKWEYPAEATVTQVVIYKQLNGQETQIVRTPKEKFYYDLALNPLTEQACYTLSYTDECGNQAPRSNAVCNILLKGTENARDIYLQWQSQQTGSGAFILEKIDLSTGKVVEIQGVSASGNLSELKESQTLAYLGYRIRTVVQKDTLFSNIFKIVLPTQIAIPTAFSPNGDGLNDTFKPLIRYVISYKLLIFNQWGNVIFETNDPNQAWDGMVGSSPSTSGVYMSQITYTDGNSVPHTLVNPLTIIR